jgi:RHS repeat-associated protein
VNLTQLLGAPSGVDVHGARVAFATETFVASYDAVGRITSFVQGSGSQTSFNYDPNGNRLASTRTDGNAVLARSYAVDAASNRVLGFAQTVSGPGGTVSTSVSYTYNAAGDVISNGLLRYGYDAEGRMASISTAGQADGATTRYLHNALGQRVFKSEPVYPAEDDASSLDSWWLRLSAFISAQWQRRSGNAEQLGWAYVYGEDGSLLGEYGNGGAQSTGSTQYIWMPTPSGPMPVAALINGVPYAIHADHLHTPRMLTDGAGQAVWQWAYSAFGEEPATAPTRASGSGLVFNLRYPGQYFDAESGLHHNYFRSYDSKTGRYTQADPIGLQGGWNRMAYVEANPLTRFDPSGRGTCYYSVSTGTNDMSFRSAGLFDHVHWGLRIWEQQYPWLQEQSGL